MNQVFMRTVLEIADRSSLRGREARPQIVEGERVEEGGGADPGPSVAMVKRSSSRRVGRLPFMITS